MHRALLLALLVAQALLVTAGAPVQAMPLAEDHLTSDLEGPAEASVTAVYWNPAALGLMGLHGEHAPNHHLLVSAIGRLQLGTIQRAPIDTMTGQPGPGANRSFSAIDALSLTPGAFIGFAYDAGPFDLGFGVSTPFARYYDVGRGPSPSQDGSNRYQGLEQLEYDTYVTGAGSVRLSDRFFLGFGFSGVRSLAHLVWDRDSALDGGSPVVSKVGYENDAWVQRVDLTGAAWSLAFSTGIVIRPTDRLTVGAAYGSRPFTPSRTDVELGPSSNAGCLLGCVNPGNVTVIDPTRPETVLSGTARVDYTLPDTFQAEVRYLFGPRLAASVTARLLNFGVLRTVDARLFGQALVEQGVPEHVALYRGLQATYSTDLRVVWSPNAEFRLGGGLIAQSSETPHDNVNPGELDAGKAEPYAQIEWSPTEHFSLSALYALSLMLPSDVNPGVYNPMDQVSCVDSHYDVSSCRQANIGVGAPTAAGHYSLLFHQLAVGGHYDF